MASYIPIKCPFCGEEDFDAIGLKGHLLRGDCKEFNETESIKRWFEEGPRHAD